MEQLKQLDWWNMVVSFLHDPPDKSLDIRGHERRAQQYLETALSSVVHRREIKMKADVDASIAERLPMPTAGFEGERAVGPENNTITVCHPLSGNALKLPVGPVNTSEVADCISEVVAGLDSSEAIFAALWRLLPERLAERNPAYLILPADTRLPDHTIWNHLDTTAALSAADMAGGVAFLSFALGPVQGFISAARSVRDLRAGSLLLSWLCFQGILPIVERCGPSALIYPSLRGLPWLDLWLRENRELSDSLDPPEPARLTIPGLPNRFLAVVPAAMADELAEESKRRARESWIHIADRVRQKLDPVYADLPFGRGWDRRWNQQIDDFFSIDTTVVCHRDCPEPLLEKLNGQPIAPRIRRLANLIPENHRPKYSQQGSGGWEALVEYSARMMAAQRQVRHFPKLPLPAKDEFYPKKCSLLGSYEQMGPDTLAESAEFWKEASGRPVKGIRLRKEERLCAVSLVKRFCDPVFFQSEFGLERERFEDTATVAARLWLEDAGIEPERWNGWNGQWLHWPRKDFGQDEGMDRVPDGLWRQLQQCRRKPDSGPSPTYYAVLMLDSDHMGQWIAGRKGPTVGAVLAPEMKDYFKGCGPDAGSILNELRPLGPAMHAAISEALTNFAVRIVPEVVQRHRGTLIYAGGDDVLALLPTATVIACAGELYRAFRGEETDGAWEGYLHADGRPLLMMGPAATLSGGVVIAHYKDDLRNVLTDARRCEKAAKRAGRNQLMFRVCRRSGEHASFSCPWSQTEPLGHLVRAFTDNASDRFAYHLAAEADTLSGLPLEVQQAEIKRQVMRAEGQTHAALSGKASAAFAGDYLVSLFKDYCASVGHSDLLSRSPLQHFVTMLQSASFLARGREI